MLGLIDLDMIIIMVMLMNVVVNSNYKLMNLFSGQLMVGVVMVVYQYGYCDKVGMLYVVIMVNGMVMYGIDVIVKDYLSYIMSDMIVMYVKIGYML